tara:strand:- start:616 stop:930 length:315 start_codon:yes stop_codon:yes gene_type:complete
MYTHIIEEKIICKSHKLFFIRIFEKKIEIKTKVINIKLLFRESLNKHIFDNSNAAKNITILSNNLTKRSFWYRIIAITKGKIINAVIILLVKLLSIIMIYRTFC